MKLKNFVKEKETSKPNSIKAFLKDDWKSRINEELKSNRNFVKKFSLEKELHNITQQRIRSINIMRVSSNQVFNGHDYLKNKKSIGVYDGRDFVLVYLGFNTGLRIGDLLNLSKHQFEDTKHLVVREQKLRKKKIIFRKLT